MAKLTEKQALFVQEYLVDLNATQAAIRAGYSEETAGAIGYENLKKPEILEKIQEAMDARAARTEITQDRVLYELAKTAFADVTDFVTVEKKKNSSVVTIKPTSEIPKEKLGAIASIKQGRSGIEVKLNDKGKALELLGRHLGMFQDKQEDHAPVTVVVNYDYGEDD